MTIGKVYDVGGLLEVLPLSRNTIYAELIAGNLVGKQVGRKWIVTEAALREYLGLNAERGTNPSVDTSVESVDLPAALRGDHCE